MGRIISSRMKKNKIIFEVEVNKCESVALEGYYDNVHLFSDKIMNAVTHISSRGKNSVTKYFLVPKHYRKNIDSRKSVTGQTIDADEKIIFIYVAKKMKVKK